MWLIHVKCHICTVISAYHPLTLWVRIPFMAIQHYVIKFVSDLRQVGGFLRVLRFPPPIKLKYCWKKSLTTPKGQSESVALNTITLTLCVLSSKYGVLLISSCSGVRLVHSCLLARVMVFNVTFNNILEVSFIGGVNESTRRKPPTCRKSLANFIT
jgi:hypothetical protein